MESYIVQVSWVLTAVCVSIGGLVMVMVTAGAGMYAIVRLYYFLKVSVEKMQQQSDAEIQTIKIERIQ